MNLHQDFSSVYSMSKPKTSQHLKSVLRWIVRVLIFQLILINISAAFHAYRFTHYYDDEKTRNLPPSHGTIFLRTWRLMTGKKLARSRIESYPQMPYDTVQLTIGNKNKINGWLIKTDSSIGTVILFHGLASNKAAVLSEAYEFLSMHYNTLLIDLRAHGSSEGIVSSLGVKESEEVKSAFDYIKGTGEKNIILWGISLGSVIITKAIDDYGIEPQKVILEMPFNKLQDHLKARARVLGFPEEPFGFLITLWSGIEQGYWGFGHNTSKYVKKIKCPVLLQWGVMDSYVLQKETETIFSSIGSKEKYLVIYQNAGHESFLNYESAKWIASVKNFLEK